MATTSAALLRTSTEEDLERQLKEAKEELFNLRFQAATGQLESHGRLRMVRRDIARIYTVLRERELGIIGFVEPSVFGSGADETDADESETDETKAEADETKAEAEDAEAADPASADEGKTTDEDASAEGAASDKEGAK